MSSVIEKDIENRINERLRVWVKDSIALYKMAEIGGPNAVTGITCALIMALNTIFLWAGASPEQAGDLMREALDAAKAAKKAAEEAER